MNVAKAASIAVGLYMLHKVGEERVLMFQQTVQAVIERVVLGDAFVHAQQIDAGGGAKPMQSRSAARREQAVERQEAEDFLPVRPFAAVAQARGEEGVELGSRLKSITQPARAPGAGAAELELGQVDLHGGRVRGGRRERARTGGSGRRVHRRDQWPSARRRAS